MAVNYDTVITADSGGAFLYEWSGGTSGYKLFTEDGAYEQRGGSQLAEITNEATTETSLILDGSDTGEPPFLEIIDNTSTSEAQTEINPPFLTLQWRGSTDAWYYLIQESVSSVWTDRGTAGGFVDPYANPDGDVRGAGYFQFKTTAVENETTPSYRVVPYDVNYTSGQPLQFDIFMVRNPAPPSISMAYTSSDGLLTVSTR